MHRDQIIVYLLRFKKTIWDKLTPEVTYMENEKQLSEKFNQVKKDTQSDLAEFAAEITGQKKKSSQKDNLTTELLTKVRVP